ncbi:Atu4866 domain-containing protein [Pseudoduganella flava]|uniref:Atu4866 domain-containing protein n=1 Tax=Pseudoduganella flava TaxID=871742 RepID=UPI0018EEF313|nr:Atu4866 domain-containing protein [Pseudoduganella flava]
MQEARKIGRCWNEGDHMEYGDDRAGRRGFTADGDLRDGVLYHAGLVLYREAG